MVPPYKLEPYGMKRVVFVARQMVCGGIERALLGAIALLDPKEFNISLLLIKRGGVLLDEVPEYVNVSYVEFDPLDEYLMTHGRVPTLKYCLRKGHWLYVARILGLRLWWTITGKKINYDYLALQSIVKRSRIDESIRNADYALAYYGGFLIGSIVRDKINAPCKAIWCHSEQEIGYIHGLQKELYASFTHRFASMDLARRINESIKYEGSKFEEFPLVVDFAAYRKLAEQGGAFDDGFGGIRILTVGRLGNQKGIDDAIRVAVGLKRRGLKFRWYVIGEGDDRAKLETLIEEMQVTDEFKLLGLKKNPYPFFKACDIYAQPSRWEAYCLTVAEARAFYKPMVVTDFIGAREQLEDGITGDIVPLGDMKMFEEKLCRLLTDEDKRISYTKALQLSESKCNANNVWKRFLGE